jgi:hypothetical protein
MVYGNAIKADLDLFLTCIQDRDGIAISDVDDFGVEVSGMNTAQGENNPQMQEEKTQGVLHVSSPIHSGWCPHEKNPVDGVQRF